MKGEVFLIASYHRSHGSCGGLYFFARGMDTGGVLTNIVTSQHLKIEQNNNVLTFKGDSWGCHFDIFMIY